MISPRSMLPLFVLCCIIFCLGAAPAYSESPTAEEIGLKIAQDSQAREAGFGNFTAQQTMVLRNKHGQESRPPTNPPRPPSNSSAPPARPRPSAVSPRSKPPAARLPSLRTGRFCRVCSVS